VTLTDSGGNLGAAGGHTWTFTGFDLSQERKLFWGPKGGTAVGLAFDGAIDTAGETMTYDATQPDLAAGKEHWSGSATFNAATWLTRFTLSVTTISGTAIPLVDATSVGITTGAGAVMQVTGDFKATMVMEAQPPAGTFGPPQPAFDAAVPHTDKGLMTSYDAGFYAIQPRLQVLPALANGAYGGYTTVAYIKNNGSSAANVFLAYFDKSGAPVGNGDSVQIPVNGSATIRQDNGNAFPAGGAGSGIVFSDRPVATFVNEFAPGGLTDATSYTGIPVPAGVASTLYAPAIANGAYGGYTTGIGLLNMGTAATDITVTYRDASGNAVKTQTLTAVPGLAYRDLYSGDATLALPAGFAGTATIVSTSTTPQPLAAVVNETGPNGQFSSYDAVAGGQTKLYAPVMLNNAYGGYYTGTGIQNTSTTAGTVTLKYYDGSGTFISQASAAIPPSAYLPFYQGDATVGPPASPTGYTGVLTSDVPIAAIINEVAPPAVTPGHPGGQPTQSTSYNTFAVGTPTVNLPLVENAGSDGWTTGLGVMNTGTATTHVTVTYYDAATGAVIPVTQSTDLAPNAFYGPYQGAPALLPPGTRATAVVTTAAGGQIVLICNEQGANAFMSYDGQ
jgi:hypothetical protein